MCRDAMLLDVTPVSHQLLRSRAFIYNHKQRERKEKKRKERERKCEAVKAGAEIEAVSLRV